MQMSGQYKTDASLRRALRGKLEDHSQAVFKQVGAGMRKQRAGRKYEEPTEMPGLYDIVVKGKRDIRRIHDAMSLAGAQRFVDKNPGRGYEAERRDLDGDGIPGVYVKKGSDFILINGYTTRQSDWSRQSAYHASNDNKAQRKANPLNKWTRDQMQLEFDNRDNQRVVTGHVQPSWNSEAMTEGFRVQRIPKNRSAYSIFCSRYVKPVWDHYIQGDVRQNPNFSVIKRSFLKVCGHLWRIVIFLPTVHANFDEDLFHAVRDETWTEYPEDIVKTIKSNTTFKEQSWRNVQQIVSWVDAGDTSTIDELMGYIDESIGLILDEARAKSLEY